MRASCPLITQGQARYHWIIFFVEFSKGKTLLEMAESDLSLSYVYDYYLNIADQILA